MFVLRASLFLLLSAGVFSDEEKSSIETLVSAPSEEDLLAKMQIGLTKPEANKDDDGYTINYNTISIIEYLRFASKICKVNFIYEEPDLDFTVTIVSDEPVTPANVMATLIQVLRVHGLLLLEQGNNLVIHKSKDVRQVASLVVEAKEKNNSPIVTRIFRVQNAKPSSIAAVIQPMISTSAMLEISPETSQLILTDITANVDKIAALIENLDSPHSFLKIKSYASKNNPSAFLVDLASQIMAPIAEGNPFLLVPQPYANEIYIVSTPELADKSLEVLANLDTKPKVKPKTGGQEEVFVYKVTGRSGSEVLKGLLSIGKNLAAFDSTDQDLVNTIEKAQWIQETNSIMLVGTKSSIEKAKELLSTLDAQESSLDSSSEKVSFFIYKPEHKTAEETRKSILEMASNLKGKTDKGLIETIDSVKLNPLTSTLSFSGPEKYFPQVRQLLSTIDAASGNGKAIALNSQFFIYKPIHQSGEQLYDSLKEIENELKTDKLSDTSLLTALATMKWVKSTNSLLFTGDPASLERIQSLIEKLDVTGSEKGKQNFFQYRPKFADSEKTENYLNQVAKSFTKKGESKSLVEALKSYKWIPESKTFMFYGTEEDLARVKEILANFDNEEAEGASYYIYKVQNTSGDLIEDDLDQLAKNLRSSGVQEPGLLSVIKNIRYVKQTNSLVLSGNPKAIAEAKKLIEEYDYPRAKIGPKNTSFFMYKPLNMPASAIQKSIKELGKDLEEAGLADPTLLSSLASAKYVSATNTLIFTGTPETLEKIKALVKDVDVPSHALTPIQHLGETTFLLYKLKNASGPQIVNSIKNMTAELKKAPNADKNLIEALKTVRYIKETDSLFFSGNESSLQKVQTLVEKFDVQGLGGISPQAPVTTSSDFFIYKPQSLKGPDLESILQGFAEQLKSSGLSDPDLFNAIHSMRFDPNTDTLVFTGDEKGLNKVKELLKEFDIPSNVKGDLAQTGPSIQAIDNTSFLVYKLQFHKGDEIQNALRQIAKDLINTNAQVNKTLLNSINSIQWLEVTNSLLCSGDQDTLTRLRELIKNLDVPLKQVFIEMLVIQTNLTNALNFGLEWGANYKYRNKFGAGTYNSMPILSGQSASQWLQNLSGIQPPTEPNPVGKVPISSGFDLGVIGEVIRHNGDTFLTLGSLLSALQTDDETSVIMTPKILTQDGRTSTIFVGENIPFVGSFVQNNGNNTVNTANLEYRDIGLNLTITPVLGNSDIVTLDINLDRSQTTSDVTGSAIDFNSLSAQGIITSKTTMQTTVHVPDNNFLILSGMVNNSNVKSKAGIPCLGGLPLVGAAFSKSADTYNNSNIVIFIRPHIINSSDDMRRVTHKEEANFRDQQGTPFLEKNFDEAMELIKTIDDE